MTVDSRSRHDFSKGRQSSCTTPLSAGTEKGTSYIVCLKSVGDLRFQPSALCEIRHASRARLQPRQAQLMYDATLGRFIQRDPIGDHGQMNLYVFVNDRPVGAVDPTGSTLTELKTVGKSSEQVKDAAAVSAGVDFKAEDPTDKRAFVQDIKGITLSCYCCPQEDSSYWVQDLTERWLVDLRYPYSTRHEQRGRLTYLIGGDQPRLVT